VTLMLVAFILAFWLDLLWVVYLKAVEGNKPVKAGAISAWLLVSSWSGGAIVVSSPLALLFAAAGAFAGTVFAIFMSKHGELK
jgi:hypothetical protein